MTTNPAATEISRLAEIAAAEITKLEEELAWTRAQKDAQATELTLAQNATDDYKQRLGNVREQRETIRHQLAGCKGRLDTARERRNALYLERSLLKTERDAAQAELAEQNEVAQAAWQEAWGSRGPLLSGVIEERDQAREQRNHAQGRLDILAAENDCSISQLNDEIDTRIAAENLNRGLTIELEQVTEERNECQRSRGGQIVKEMELEKQINHLVNMLDNAGPVVDLANEACDAARAERDILRMEKIDLITQLNAAVLGYTGQATTSRRLDKELEVMHRLNKGLITSTDLANAAVDQARAERDQARGDAMATHETVERLARELAKESADLVKVKQYLENNLKRTAPSTVEQRTVEQLVGELATMRDCHRGLLDDYHKMRGERNQLRKDLVRKNDGE